MPLRHAQVTPIIERGMPREAEEAPAPAAPTAAGVGGQPELEQPLLAEEAPPPTPAGERAGLAKALAIIRWALPCHHWRCRGREVQPKVQPGTC